MEPSDIDLIYDLRKSDVSAFNKIYAKYAVHLYRFAFKYLKTKEEAEELVQSVFLKIWEGRRSIKTDTSFRSYLFTITYNDICKLFRRRKFCQEFTKEQLSIIDRSFNIEERIDYTNLLTRIDKIVDKLPEKQKGVFIKSRHEGKSSKEIAVEVGLSPGTIDNYISESTKLIKTKLKIDSFY